MPENQKTGLIIGKFAPLHLGHKYLIDSALSKVDRLIVLVYDVPELTSVPVAARMNWIKRLYPAVTVINAGIGPRELGSTPEINRMHTDYAKSKLPPGVKIDFVFSSEDYGRFLAEALGAENFLVDRERATIPISAGSIRNNPENHSKYLEDFVYADLIKYDNN